MYVSKIFKCSVLAVAFLILLNIVPHVVVRIFAESNAVKIFGESVATAEFSETVMVATYNIAHGRCGKYGAKNWGEESASDRKLRLLSIAEHFKEQDRESGMRKPGNRGKGT